MAALQKAETDRDIIIIDLENVESRIAEKETVPISQQFAEVQIKKLSTLVVSLRDAHFRIMQSLIVPETKQTHITTYSNLTHRMEIATASLLEIKATFVQESTPASSSSSSTPSKQNSVKLPDCKLPICTSKFEDWMSFSDVFRATIHSNSTLSPALKLQYLKGCCQTGTAESLIKHLPITDANYQIAWDLLEKNFNNKREIVAALCRKLLHQPSLKSESSAQLQTMLNTTMECIHSLTTLGCDKWETLLITSLTEKLDSESKSEWAKKQTSTTPPTLKELTDFIELQIRSLTARGIINSKPQQQNNGQKHQAKAQHYARSHYASSDSSACKLCNNGTHPLYKCSKLQSMDSSARSPAVKQIGACTNCLRQDHTNSTCKSTYRCRTCEGRHHTLLHDSNKAQPTSRNTMRSHTSTVFEEHHATQVLLKTAVAIIHDSSGTPRHCRILLDDGSEASFITTKCANALNLPKQKTNMIIEGIAGARGGTIQEKMEATIHSRVHDAHFTVDLLILPKVTGTLPRYQCDYHKWTHLANLQLADEQYYHPGNIDILLGADVVHSIMRDGRREGPKFTPTAMNSILGWVLSGKVNTTSSSIIRAHHAHITLEEIVQKFWEITEVPKKKLLTLEEIEAESHFTTTFTRKPDGRYMVRLPFNDKINQLGHSKDAADRRLLALERRFKKFPVQHKQYTEFMDEYVKLGHMEEIPDLHHATPAYYIPHHFVVKLDSSTTKLRVVFDASMSSSTGISLNDALLVGPTIQEDLITLIMQFRLHQVALKADIAKMYRQFEIDERDRNYLLIRWRNKDGNIATFRLNTITYGTASAPFLATRCLNQLATDEQCNFPLAAAALLNSMYVDDFLGGADDDKEAFDLHNEMMQICAAGQMEIRKWCSSSTTILNSIPDDIKETVSHDFDDDSSIKTLGIRWKPEGDYFHFNFNSPTERATTKRQILSEVAKTFDPLGWISPVTISAKIILQALWKAEIDWDTSAPESIQLSWDSYQNQLYHAEQLKILRKVIPSLTCDLQLHGFADASEKAYAAVVYIRCNDEEGNIATQLITSKTRVAPLKSTSLPRLKLCAAHLLSETIQQVSHALQKYKFTMHCWTDSMITLNWITAPSHRWKTYVANRVAAIQEVIHPRCWHHVSSGDNPADLPSRGISAKEIINNNLWWHGPAWLSTNNFPINNSSTLCSTADMEEKTPTIKTHHSTASFNYLQFMERFSSLNKIVKTTAWFRRYLQWIKHHATAPSGPLTPAELNSSLQKIIAIAQQQSFSKDIAKLQSSAGLSTKSPLLKLNPFIDANNIVRVGGRLQQANIPYDSSHPIILPSSNFITEKIVHECHLDTLHGGFSLVWSTLRRKYWIMHGRDTVRHSINKCIMCKKQKAVVQEQLMGNLPAARVNIHRPFLHCGTDLAGPFLIRRSRGRNSPQEKVYMCFFVCLSTKAIHLEAVTSLSTDAFLQSFKRFIARRGIPSDMYSDCGTNFRGAEKELSLMFKEKHQAQQQLANQGVTWHFNSPSSPHKGGLWEAAVKSAKYHFYRVVGQTPLSLEQFITLLANIEACLNSRPLCTLSSDPTDTNSLTPGHFLIGQPIISLPEPDVTTQPINKLSQWKHVVQITQHWWSRWQNEYLDSLQSRGKWKRKTDNLCVDDLVVIREDNIAPCNWKLGRIMQAKPSDDGLVRTVIVKTSTGTYTRPIHKLSLILKHNE